MLISRGMANSSVGNAKRRLPIALMLVTAVILTQAELSRDKHGQNQGDGSSESPPRRLQRVIGPSDVLQNADSFYVSELATIDKPGLCQPPSCLDMVLYAGQLYAVAEIRLMINQESWNAPDARLKMVTSTLQQDQLTDECKTDAALVTSTNVSDMWWDSGNGVSTTPVGYKLKADYSLTFQMAGSYKVCYSYTGTFNAGEAQLVSNALLTVNVYGVYDFNCPQTSPTCLSERRHECYLRRLNFNTKPISNQADAEFGLSKYGLSTSCVVDFAKYQNGYLGAAGKGSWSGEWVMPTPGYDSSGQAMAGSLVKTPCGTVPAAFICRDGGACDSGDAKIDLVVPPTIPASSTGESFGRVQIPTTSNQLEGSLGNSVYKARSVFACYCPNKDGCDDDIDFVQQIGVLHFYATKVCHADDATCDTDYTGMVAQYRFRIRVECPTTACEFTDLNRLKLVQQPLDGSGLPSNDLPSWDSNSGCGSAIHGELLTGNANNMRFALPTFQITPIDGRLPGTVNNHNCMTGAGNQNKCHLSGGSRQDYKEFPNSQTPGDYGFQWVLGTTNHEERTFHSTKHIDICYCNSMCETNGNWFKVGSMRLSPTRLVSAATSRSNLPEQWSIEYMNQQGTVGIARPYADEFTLGMQQDSLLKILQDDAREIGEFGTKNCGEEGYNSQFTEGLANPVQASLNYLGKLQMQTPPDLQKIVFNSDAFVNTITVTQGGSLAVCYCAITRDTTCTSSSNWKLITHMTIKGPKFNQRWQFSTNVVFRFSYEGYGLTDGDTLRIISADGQCTDNNFNPNTAAFAYTGLKVNCPVPCNEVGTVSDTVTGDLSTKVLSQDAYSCNRENAACATNDIIKVEVYNEHFTDLYFQQDPRLEVGQEITLGDNIDCDPSDSVCTAEMVSALKGVFSFADENNNNGQAPNRYVLTHKIAEIVPTTQADCPNNPPGVSWPACQKLRIPIGWPSSHRPKFRVTMAGANILIGNFGRGGQWTMHSKATTKEEIVGLAEKANLKVCWRFGGDPSTAKYVAEVGRMTIRNPAPMEGNMLSMTTTARGQLSPFVLTFKTADGVTGLRYDEAADSLRFKIVLTDTRLIDIYYSDMAGTEIPASVPTDDEMEEASQAICGKLFLEVWSDDMTNGFPLPKGCWYNTFVGSGTAGQLDYVPSTRELYLIFEAKTGFKKDTIYQIVMNMKVKGDPQNIGTDPEVTTGGQYMSLYSLDDVSLRPYEAIESGTVRLTTEPQSPSFEQEDPRFRTPDGFKLTGGHQELLELNSGDSIVAEIQGDRMNQGTSGAIKHSQILRVFLWPLLQWQTTSSCTAACVFGAEKSFKCGTINVCLGLPTVPSMSLNILKIVLPDQNNWPDPGGLYGDTKIGIRIGGITPPTGGFFAERIPAQITKSDDTRPNYIMSTGDYLWKKPNEGTTISKVVGTLGGGNTRPFKQETDNVLYVRMILSSTLKARLTFGTDAFFTVTLPAGYTCLDKNPTMTAGQNAWVVPMDLEAFGTKVPQGRGMPDAGGTDHGWSVTGNTCTFTPKHPNGIVFAGSSIMFTVYANNPTAALKRTDASNYWTMRMSNRGEHPTLMQTTSEYPFLHTGDPNYQANYAVLGRITDASCQPTTFEPSSKRAEPQELRFFFKTEQQIVAGGYVRISAPSGFSFNYPDLTLPICNATNLDDAYYVEPANPLDATLRLPGIKGCTTLLSGRQAVVGVTDIIKGGRMFGMKIWVVNPTGWDNAHSSGWEVYTMDDAQNLVDGTMESVPFQEDSTNSWGLYTSQTLSGRIHYYNTQPYVMTGQPALVKFSIWGMPTGQSGWSRIIAPQDYQWEFSPETFVYQRRFADLPANMKPFLPADDAAYWSPQSTPLEPWPLGVPVAGNGTDTLIWETGFFNIQYYYGFACFVRVPTRVPASSTNAFFLEFGFNSTSTVGRKAAHVFFAPRVKALVNSYVDYTTNIKFKENIVQFRLETISTIMPPGGIEIEAPPGFTIAENCEIIPVNDPTASNPPGWNGQESTVTCTRLTPAGFNPSPIIRLAAPSGGISPGIHHFAIVTENPTNPVLNQISLSEPCGKMVCWKFQSFVNLNDKAAGELDYHTYAPGFPINDKMLEARIPILTEAQRRGTNRDDRPMNPNSVIFAFKLSANASTDGQMLVRGPHGFVFAETCTNSIEISESSVFGVGNRFPPDYSVWPVGVTITACAGEGSVANLTLKYATGAKLLRNKLYLFRMGIELNPLTTPVPNRWAIEVNKESSEPFEGMTLWAFTDTHILPTTTNRERTLAAATRTPNALNITIRPHNTIEQDGYIAIQAPYAYQFKHLPSMECDAQLEQVEYLQLGVLYKSYTWPTSDLTCLVTKDTDSSLATVRLRSTVPVVAGLQYILTVFTYNPSANELVTGSPTVWKVSSYTSIGLTLDESLISAFVLNPVMNLFQYAAVNQNGGTSLPDFELSLRFPDVLVDTDRIEIDILAPEFNLKNATGHCSGFRYVGTNPFTHTLLPTCTRSKMVWQIKEPLPGIPQDTLIHFKLSIVNPLKTPNAAVNFWVCTHYSSNGLVKSSKAAESWEIIPQLEQVTVELLGPNRAAESISTLRIAFTAVNDAEDIAIEATAPERFDFANAVPSDSGQSIILRQGNIIRLAFRIQALVRYTIVLSQVTLGREGGQTLFTLSTWVGGMFQSGEWKPGTKRDEKLNYQGFRLPGRTILSIAKLENPYHRDPNAYPVQSIWEALMGRPCYVEFHFQVTQRALAGTNLYITGNVFMPTMTQFELTVAPPAIVAGQTSTSSQVMPVVSTEVTSAPRGTRFMARLNEPLEPYTKYKVILSQIAPSPYEVQDYGAPITWTVETLDSLGTSEPVNTNDGESRVFKIVEQYGFEVHVSRAPPVAEVIVSLTITPILTIPTELRIVAPLGFNFTQQNCLVAGLPVIVSCTPSEPIADGRSTALLRTRDAGLRLPPPTDLRIRVTTPKATPIDRDWFVEGIDALTDTQLGWGQAVGFDIKNMSDITVSYPAIPGELGFIAWRFRSEVLIQAGGTLVIDMPPELGAECFLPNRFEPITLPASGGCKTEQNGAKITVFLNATIVPAEYAFGYYVIPPVDTPVRNTLSITLKDKFGSVRDAATDLPGNIMREKLKIKSLPLVWDISSPGRTSMVTVGFDVIEPLPDNVVAPHQQIFTILITLPVGFIHLIEDSTDFQILNEDMPLATPQHLNYLAKNYIILYMNPNQTSWLSLKAGQYSFKFPVLIPDILPAYNVWQMSLCRPNYGPCNRVSAPAVLVNFVEKGFIFDQVWVDPVTAAPKVGVTTNAAHVLRLARVLFFGFLGLTSLHFS